MYITERAKIFIHEEAKIHSEPIVLIIQTTRNVCCGSLEVPSILVSDRTSLGVASHYEKKDLDDFDLDLYIEIKIADQWASGKIDSIGLGFARRLLFLEDKNQ